MTKILIGYGTTEGQTARIADHLAEAVRSHGLEAQALDLKESKDVGLEGYDAVIVGGSIHMGKHEEYVVDFVRKNRATLEGLPSAFFSVSLAAHGDMDNAGPMSRTSSRKRAGGQLRSVSLAAPCFTASTGSSNAS